MGSLTTIGEIKKQDHSRTFYSQFLLGVSSLESEEWGVVRVGGAVGGEFARVAELRGRRN